MNPQHTSQQPLFRSGTVLITPGAFLDLANAPINC